MIMVVVVNMANMGLYKVSVADPMVGHKNWTEIFRAVANIWVLVKESMILTVELIQ